MNTPAVEIRGVSRRFGSLRALSEVTLDIPAGSIFGLLGPNGAGKTTLFSIIAGFLRAHAGTISVLGHDARAARALAGRLSILPQDAQYQRDVPIIEQLIFFRRLGGATRADARAEVLRVLASVGLEDYAMRGAEILSHGMYKRLGIAQAFLGSPEVILLDEPTAGLDPQNAKQVREIVLGLRSQRTIVISSHNLREIQEICDHVAILDKGKLIASGAVAEITHAGTYCNIELPRVLTNEEGALLSRIDGVQEIAGATTTTLRFRLREEAGDEVVDRLLRALLDQKLVPRAVSRGRSLEERFLALTGKDAEKP